MKIPFVYQSLILINLIIIFEIIDTLKTSDLINIHLDELSKSFPSSTPSLKGQVKNLDEKYFSQYVSIFYNQKKSNFNYYYLFFY